MQAVVLWWWFGGALVVVRWCFGGGSVVLWWWFGGALVVVRWCFSGGEVVRFRPPLFSALSRVYANFSEHFSKQDLPSLKLVFGLEQIVHAIMWNGLICFRICNIFNNP